MQCDHGVPFPIECPTCIQEADARAAKRKAGIALIAARDDVLRAAKEWRDSEVDGYEDAHAALEAAVDRLARLEGA